MSLCSVESGAPPMRSTRDVISSSAPERIRRPIGLPIDSCFVELSTGHHHFLSGGEIADDLVVLHAASVPDVCTQLKRVTHRGFSRTRFPRADRSVSERSA